MAIFGRPKYTLVKIAKRKEIPDGLWTKCEDCGEIIYNKTLEENFKVCPKCNYHFVLTASERITLLLDKDSFKERDAELSSLDPLEFKGPVTYKEKLQKEQELTGLKDAVVSGEGTIEGKRVAFAVTDARFMMGSMGSVVGERITRIIEFALEKKLPLIIVSGSGGGARMQEGMFSLMQMAKTSAALSRFHRSGQCFISLLTHPTMAGVLASFASLGDVLIAEPKALIGFTGPRVIEQTIHQVLPSGFQRAEFLLEHGLIDMIVQRKDLKATLSQLLEYLS
ncbi:MAG: acetyl-CoA carboxylase, carboxyltransferase subunit beta [Candidatus Omnitrophica bacterium]|nr:acetyl-CoA carboxylase, carboxyltransferase subunit beta [Candidatus Omnitrophota bacterium]MCM8792949.1 acetyl-CoA carboxylase, carboxyltransferase subunit beta [Candidatus Omnitrophota bacterium]